jgi:uncharacterized phage-associated protein
MTYQVRIPDWFPVRKAAQVAAFFAAKAGGRINILRLTKLIYLADRASLAQREYPITGDDFVSMPFGPVNTYTYSLMRNEGQPEKISIWQEYMGKRIKHEISVKKPNLTPENDLKELSRSDVRLLNAVWDSFEDISDQFELAEWTHKYCPEWQDPHGSSIPIPFATVFKKLDKKEPTELSEAIRAERQFSMSVGN